MTAKNLLAKVTDCRRESDNANASGTKSEGELLEVFGGLDFYNGNPKKSVAEDEAPEALTLDEPGTDVSQDGLSVSQVIQVIEIVPCGSQLTKGVSTHVIELSGDGADTSKLTSTFPQKSPECETFEREEGQNNLWFECPDLGGLSPAQVELVSTLNDKTSASKENLDHLYDGDLSSSFSSLDESASDVKGSCEALKQAETSRQAKSVSDVGESCETFKQAETFRYADECEQSRRINYSFNKVNFCTEVKRASISTSGSKTQKSTILRTKIMKPFDSIRKSIRKSRRGSSGILADSLDLAYSKALNNVSSKASVTSSGSIGKPFSLVKHAFGSLRRRRVPSSAEKGDDSWLD